MKKWKVVNTSSGEGQISTNLNLLNPYAAKNPEKVSASVIKKTTS